ncbi:MAG: nucleotidyltransferase domain-containing protein [Acidobacteria bacterium]|nr:nucleotidyltransferase domain-containing protein [Acidobacteriota bacterium]
MEKEKLLEELVKRLREAYGNDLVSVVLYGSAASDDYQKKYSDLNVLCTLRQVGVPELRRGAKAIDWWIKQKQPAPLLLSLEETENSHDAFPVEFLDIQQSHRILYGEDLVAGIQVDTRHHRRQVEHELRSDVLRLRERYLRLQRHDKEVIRLMVESLPAIATMVRHALILAGVTAPARKRETFQAASSHVSIEAAPFLTVLGICEGSAKPPSNQVHDLFAAYLEQVSRLAVAVDQMGKRP